VASPIGNSPRSLHVALPILTYALDDAFYRAAADDDVKVVVLAGAGDHFSAGHDIGSPGRAVHKSFHRRATLWRDHVDKEGVDSRDRKSTRLNSSHVKTSYAV